MTSTTRLAQIEAGLAKARQFAAERAAELETLERAFVPNFAKIDQCRRALMFDQEDVAAWEEDLAEASPKQLAAAE